MAWLADTWAATWPNLLASVIWATPAFTAHHVLMRRHVDRRHRQLLAAGAAATPITAPDPPERGTAMTTPPTPAHQPSLLARVKAFLTEGHGSHAALFVEAVTEIHDLAGRLLKLEEEVSALILHVGPANVQAAEDAAAALGQQVAHDAATWSAVAVPDGADVAKPTGP